MTRSVPSHHPSSAPAGHTVLEVLLLLNRALALLYAGAGAQSQCRNARLYSPPLLTQRLLPHASFGASPTPPAPTVHPNTALQPNAGGALGSPTPQISLTAPQNTPAYSTRQQICVRTFTSHNRTAKSNHTPPATRRKTICDWLSTVSNMFCGSQAHLTVYLSHLLFRF